MPDLIDIIDDYFPANGDVAVPLNSEIWILFSEEMNTSGLEESFFVEGPDTDQYVGPGLLNLVHPDNVSQGDLNDFLRSPGYQGIVEGTFTFKQIDVSDPDLEVSGSPYRTKMIFTPTRPLAELYDYNAILLDSSTLSGVEYTGHLTWSFQTGTGSIVELPSTTSTSVLSTGSQAEAALDTSFSVSSTVPADYAIEQSVDLNEITINFSKTIDASTVTDANVTVQAERITDHPNLTIATSGELTKTLAVAGNTLTISDISDQIFANNIVLVTLASGITSSAGVGLEEAYEFEFLTTADPAYSSVRKIRLEVGGHISNVKDYTIQMANLEASIEADVLTFVTSGENTSVFRHARRQYVTCTAAQMLLGGGGFRGLKSKSLGDLRVEYDNTGLTDTLGRLHDCITRWEPQLLAGGLAKKNTSPKGVVKGDLDPDRPIASRQWHSTQSGQSRNIPAANERIKYDGHRRYLRTYRKKWW